MKKTLQETRNELAERYLERSKPAMWILKETCNLLNYRIEKYYVGGHDSIPVKVVIEIEGIKAVNKKHAQLIIKNIYKAVGSYNSLIKRR